MLSVIVDHYDTRDNEARYNRFAKATLFAAGALLLAAVASDLMFFKSGSYERERNWRPWANQSFKPTSTPPLRSGAAAA